MKTFGLTRRSAHSGKAVVASMIRSLFAANTIGVERSPRFDGFRELVEFHEHEAGDKVDRANHAAPEAFARLESRRAGQGSSSPEAAP